MNIDQLEQHLEERVKDLGKKIDQHAEDENELFNRQLEVLDILGLINPIKKEKYYAELGLDPSKI